MFSVLTKLAPLALLLRSASAISWALIFSNGNVWSELEYTITVPPAPPSDVTSGPWFFWCGLQPNGGGVVQPVLQWGQLGPSYVNPNPVFAKIWAMILWTVPASGLNNNNAFQSPGIWAAQGDKIDSFMTYNNNVWVQTARVTSGQASGQNTVSNLSASQFFHTDSAGDSNANFFVCESELDGSQTNRWNFNVTFTNINLRAKTNTGVQSLCASAVSHSDGNGFATIQGFRMLNDTTCHWDTVILTPP
ncbi:hypothetical protein EXIGLDRAFT_734349 [Exidia glandulosa HHB12029]|uniref:Concanavalin A-like lectin/glucanase n=1 Tax=Exidia glandulosa HHB12029 TaxID=1314781 RepID=A0A165K681_EXIGL|nr:hypothetical protein EXIGLDRAFT_734349 [Exidia glandulosa HHB12029]